MSIFKPFTTYLLLATMTSTLIPGIIWGGEGSKDLKGEIARKESQLLELRRAMKAKMAEIEALGLKERSLLAAIEALDRRLNKKEVELKEIKRKKKRLEADIRSLKKEIETLKGKELALRERLKDRMVVAYKMQKGRLVDFLLSSEDLPTFERGYRYLEALARYDLSLIRMHRDTVDRLRKGMAELKERKKKLTIIEAKLKEKRRELSSERRKKERLVREIRKSRELSLIALKEMEEASMKMESRIEELRNRYRGMLVGKGFAALKGDLEMPVDGVVVSFYGKKRDPRFNTFFFNKGIEIEAPAGAEVRSVYNGKVVFADWFKGYGLTMIIDNGDGYYTVFAHLSRIFKRAGEKVEKGEVVALVGDTGSLEGPRLYFEIRHHGIPKDPLEWVSMR